MSTPGISQNRWCLCAKVPLIHYFSLPLHIGLAAKVVAMPMATYSSKSIKHEWTFGLSRWGAQTGGVSSPLRVAGLRRQHEWLRDIQLGEYCNPMMDVVLEKALATMDDNERARRFQEATEIAVDDGGIIPIHLHGDHLGKGVVYVPRIDERSLAQFFKPQ